MTKISKDVKLKKVLSDCPLIKRREMENKLMVLKEVAEYLHCSSDTIRTWRKTKDFPCINISHRFVRYRKREIDNWLRKHKLNPEK